MRVRISEPNEKISKEDIDNFQHKYNIELPVEYINFLLEYNGGIPDIECYFKINNENIPEINWDRVREFYSLQKITEMLEISKPDEDDYPEFVIHDKIITKNKILIGEGYPFLPICMDITKEKDNKIYYLELDDDWELCKIAENFDEFINSFEMVITED